MLRLQSPAKINLFLKILCKRPDGYHELASLFQTVSLFDTLHLELAEVDQLTTTDPSIPTDHSNLVLKAANLFRQKTGSKFGIKVHLEKRIPNQAGLGGGSSNAATTLWGLNQLLNQGISESTLAEWGAELGSDISFFFSNGTAYCTGRGEKVRSLPPNPRSELWIIKPNTGLSTPAVYGSLKLDELKPWNPLAHLSAISERAFAYHNDLETPAFSLKPDLKVLKQKLISIGFHTVVMSGSGTAFFCLGDPKVDLVDEDLFIQKAHYVQRTLSHEWYVNP